MPKPTSDPSKCNGLGRRRRPRYSNRIPTRSKRRSERDKSPNRCPGRHEERRSHKYALDSGFSQCLIRSALIKSSQASDVYIAQRKSMTIRFFIHSRSKRAKSLALIDSGATENFISLEYVKYLHLPIKRLAQPQKLFNVDKTLNKAGDLQYYTDLQVQTGTQRTNLRFFLTNLEENKAILGYPWFAAVQPKIDWKRGWIDHSQLPVIFRSPDAAKARFVPQTVNRPRPTQADQIFIGRVVIGEPENIPNLKIPPSRLWDHAIELKPGAPASLPAKLIRLSQTELAELRKFIKEHLGRGTIRPSKSPYTASFFFIKKKDGTLRPVQDYRPVNKWSI